MNEKISILVPSRNRPERLLAMVDSARTTATGDPTGIEVVCRIDLDDPQQRAYEILAKTGVIGILCKGSRVVMSDLWNDCSRFATGDIQMYVGDDTIFRTVGWDEIVRTAFAESEDKIILVFGSDGHQPFSTYFFLHRNWIDAVGRFTAPYFSADFSDLWAWDVAGLIDRRREVPILCEHLHPSWGTAELDQTYQENRDRSNRDRPWEIYNAKGGEREQEAAKLRRVMRV